jgi:hypothetical protein
MSRVDRIWQWAWDRYGARYTWAVFAISYLAVLPVWLISAFVVVALEESGRYVEATAVAVGGRPRGRSGDGIGGHLHVGSGTRPSKLWPRDRPNSSTADPTR